MSPSGPVSSNVAARKPHRHSTRKLATHVLCLSALCTPLVALAGCCTEEREQYYGSRQRVISADAGDSSAIVSRVRQPSTMARAGAIRP